MPELVVPKSMPTIICAPPLEFWRNYNYNQAPEKWQFFGVNEYSDQAFYHHLAREKNWLKQAGQWQAHHLNDLLA
jgi:hypothetical protein